MRIRVKCMRNRPICTLRTPSAGDAYLLCLEHSGKWTWDFPKHAKDQILIDPAMR